MKIAVSSSGESLNAQVDPRFGRCACFAIVDAETMDVHIVPNPGATMGQGAGIQAAQAVAAEGVDAVISGQMGPNAYQALAAADIRMLAAPAGTVRQAVEHFRADALPWITGATVPGHHGLGAVNATPTGQPGMGRGMAWRHGTGHGHGRGHAHGWNRRPGRGPAW